MIAKVVPERATPDSRTPFRQWVHENLPLIQRAYAEAIKAHPHLTIAEFMKELAAFKQPQKPD